MINKIKNISKKIISNNKSDEEIVGKCKDIVDLFYDRFYPEYKFSTFYKFTGFNLSYSSIFSKLYKVDSSYLKLFNKLIYTKLNYDYWKNRIDKRNYEFRDTIFHPNEFINIEKRQYDFLFIASMNYYLNPFINFAKRCKHNNIKFAFIIPRAGKKWSNFNKITKYNYYFFEDFYSIQNSKLADHNREQNLFNFINNQQKIKKTLNYKNIDIYNIIENQLKWFITDFFKYSDSCHYIAKNIYDLLEPSAIFTPRFRRALDLSFIEEAKKASIKTYMILHGNIAYKPHNRIIEGEYHTADKIFVFNKFDRTTIKRWDPITESKKIKNIGSPIWENLSDLNKDKLNQELKTNFNIPKENKIVTFISQGESLKNEFMIISETLKYIDNLFLIIKGRIGEDTTWYKDILENVGFNNYMVLNDKIEGFDTQDLVAGSYIILTAFSTVIYDALFSNIPIVRFSFSNRNEFPMKLFDYINAITNKNKFKETINKLISVEVYYNKYKKEQYKIAKTFGLNKHKNASQNIINEINKDIDI